ncbi:erythromycin esterase family protein [Streptomyces sp. ET3-23]|uniref:erythromycin esterase family protein n=1 Tax=Streptomyces sp. ET3-23 TaxID=2885643 RepID=UPI001D101916|nr:erythromycin esterase family protein [Streptomyces sp. ET3-23]MCC2280311.1 erythromycin esterase family protein [Streptomyces sp. ET3-23]
MSGCVLNLRFTVFAMEFGFSEAFPLDRWLQGEGDDGDLAKASRAAADLMHWLRHHNRTSGRPLRFAGLDLPEAGDQRPVPRGLRFRRGGRARMGRPGGRRAERTDRRTGAAVAATACRRTALRVPQRPEPFRCRPTPGSPTGSP